MQKTKLIRFVESFVLLPIITMSGSLGMSLPQTGSSILSTSQFMFSEEGQAFLEDAKEAEAEIVLQAKAKAVDAYFRDRNMPLVGKGEKLVVEAERNGLDWRLVAAIAVRESTGGKHACKKAPNNPFGWNSCKVGFDSYDEAIETVARNLGGNNPNTAFHYKNKDVVGILRAYNPPSIVPRYAEQVISIMNAISELEIVLAPDTNANSQG